MRILCLLLCVISFRAFAVDREEQRRLSDYLRILRESSPSSAVSLAILKQLKTFDDAALKKMAVQGLYKEYLARGGELVKQCRKEAYPAIKNSYMEKVDFIKEKLTFLRGVGEITEEKLTKINKANDELEEIFVPAKLDWSDQVNAQRKLFEEMGKCLNGLDSEIETSDFSSIEYIAKVSVCPLLLKDKRANSNLGMISSVPFQVSLAASQINLIRIFSGKNTLLIDPRLNLMARSHSKDMSDNNYFGHDSPTEGMKTTEDRAAFYKTTVGHEILGRGTDDVLKLNKAYLKRLKNAGAYYQPWTRIGVGYYKKHWTEVFGK